MSLPNTKAHLLSAWHCRQVSGGRSNPTPLTSIHKARAILSSSPPIQKSTSQPPEGSVKLSLLDEARKKLPSRTWRWLPIPSHPFPFCCPTKWRLLSSAWSAEQFRTDPTRVCQVKCMLTSCEACSPEEATAQGSGGGLASLTAPPS